MFKTKKIEIQTRKEITRSEVSVVKGVVRMTAEVHSDVLAKCPQ
jgi:hypothetical protein